MIGNPFQGVPYVCSDHKNGMRLLTEHIIKQGRRKLAMIGPVAENEEDKSRFYDYNERVLGFRSAANSAGILIEDAKVISHPDLIDVNDEYKPGYTAMRKIIESGKLPEAVICVNDRWASGAMRACREAGIGVPDDIAFGGFDNNGFAPYLCSPLTSVAQPSARIGQVAVDLLMRWIRGEDIPERDTKILLPCELVVRKSCGCGK
jgi:LacI family transcriptional regulator